MNKKELRGNAILLLGLHLIYAVLRAVDHYISYDAVLSGSFWLVFPLDFLLHTLEVLGITAAIGMLVISVYRSTWKKCTPLYILIGACLLFKYIATIAAVSIAGGSLDLTADFSGYLVSLLIEIVTFALAVFITHKLTYTLLKDDREKAAASQKLGKEYQPLPDFTVFRLSRPFSRKNPLMRTVFWSVFAVFALRLISYLISEIAMTVMVFGLELADVFTILLNLTVLMLLPAFLGYLFALGYILRLKKQENK